MFSDESTFKLVRGVPNMVRRPSTASRYDPKFKVKTVKHPGSVMVWVLLVEIWTGQVCTSFPTM